MTSRQNNDETVAFFEKNNYQNPIIYEDIIECKEYEAFGCKIIPQKEEG